MKNISFHNLLDILYVDVVKYNEIHNIDYFKKKTENVNVDDNIKNKIKHICDEIIVNINKYPDRKDNLNMFLEILQKIK